MHALDIEFICKELPLNLYDDESVTEKKSFIKYMSFEEEN